MEFCLKFFKSRIHTNFISREYAQIFNLANTHEYEHEFHEFTDIYEFGNEFHEFILLAEEASFPRSDLGEIKNQRSKTKNINSFTRRRGGFPLLPERPDVEGGYCLPWVSNKPIKSSEFSSFTHRRGGSVAYPG